jgi:hypothetical protein
MKKFFSYLLSDSNRVSTKRFIGLIAVLMFVCYGILGLIRNVDINFWVFYVSLCAITMWIAFKFMSAEKILKYNILGELSKFGKISSIDMDKKIEEIVKNEQTIDEAIRPETPIEQIPPVPKEKKKKNNI